LNKIEKHENPERLLFKRKTKNGRANKNRIKRFTINLKRFQSEYTDW